MKTFGKYLEEKNKGLWDNIHAKRKRGEKMRKPGSKGAPTDADFKRSQEESVEEKKLTAAELKKREEIAKAMERDNPGMDMSKKMAIATATAKKVAEEKSLDITEISLDMLTKKISNSGMATTKKANKIDKTKDDLAALKARLAGKPAMAKEATELDELSKKTLGSYYKAANQDLQKRGSSLRKTDDSTNKFRSRLKYAAKAKYKSDRMDEEVELDEGSRDIKQPGPHPDMVKAGIKHTHLQSPFKKSKTYVTVDKKDHAKAKKVLGNQTVANGGNVYLEIKESVELDEAPRKKGAPKMTGDSFAIQRAKDAELNKALGRTKTGRKKPARQMTSTQRSLASLRNEAVVSADKKPEKFVKPDGTVGIRMVRVDNQVIKKDA